jgi:hypothetical protein
MSRWRWIQHEGQRLHDVGVDADGHLHNPNGYDAALVRAAVREAEARQHARRSRAATRAAETRRHRQQQHVYAVARQLLNGHAYGPRYRCIVCHKGLTDAETIARGIGSDCWQDVLRIIEAEANDAELRGQTRGRRTGP